MANDNYAVGWGNVSHLIAWRRNGGNQTVDPVGMSIPELIQGFTVMPIPIAVLVLGGAIPGNLDCGGWGANPGLLIADGWYILNTEPGLSIGAEVGEFSLEAGRRRNQAMVYVQSS